MDFDNYDAAGFGPDLLPVLPHDARINPKSPSKAQLESSLGKVPGKLDTDGTWFGFVDWQKNTSDAEAIARWGRWRLRTNCGIGFQGRRFPGLDIDVNDEALADRIEALALLELGVAPCRFGRSPRRLLVYRGSDFHKIRVAFKASGATGADKPQAVELLATGQHYVVEGVHPGTRKPYHWRDDRSPASIGAVGITEVTTEQVEAFFYALEALLLECGCEIVTREKANARGFADVDQDALKAPSLADLSAALEKIPNDRSVDRGRWVAIGHAVKAAGDEDAYDVFEQWCGSEEWPENTPDVVQRLWDGLKPPHELGWPWLKEEAKKNGFNAASYDFEPAPAAADGSLALGGEIADRFAYIRTEDRIVELTGSRHTYNKNNFNSAFGHLADKRPGVPPADRQPWSRVLSVLRAADRADQPRMLERIVREPGQDVFYREEIYSPQREPITVTSLNFWQPSRAIMTAPKGVTAADVEPYLNLWRRFISAAGEGEQKLQQALQLVAAPIASPGLKTGRILAMHSDAGGTGKGLTTITPIMDALGKEDADKVQHLEELGASFNEYRQRLALCIPEIDSASSRHIASLLKALTDDDGGLVEVNVKYGHKIRVRDALNIYINTNHLHYLPMEGNPRRWFVLSADLEPLTAEENYNYWTWYDRDGGREKVIGFLAHTVDMSLDEGWWRRENGAITLGVSAALEASEPVIMQDLRELLDDREVIISVKMLLDEAEKSKAFSSFTRQNMNAQNLARHLKALNYIQPLGREKVRLSADLGRRHPHLPANCRPYFLVKTTTQRRAAEAWSSEFVAAQLERAISEWKHIPSSHRADWILPEGQEASQ